MEGRRQRHENGNAYVGTVNHFSTWNLDLPEKAATVKGKVVDGCSNNSPVSGAVVFIGQLSTYTDRDGNYSLIVPGNRALSVRIVSEHNFGRTFTKDIPAVNEGATSVQDITLACGPTLTGRIVDCDGKPIDGLVILEHNNAVVASMYTDVEHKFQLYGPAGAAVKLKVLNKDKEVKILTETMPATPTAKNLGDVEHCVDVPQVGASFWYRDGAAQQQFIYTNVNEAVAYLYDNGVTYSEVRTTAQEVLTLDFTGQSTGATYEGPLLVRFGNKEYTAEKATIKLSRNDGWSYGYMIGSFSGTATLKGTSTKIEIYDGKFVVKILEAVGW